MTDRETKKRIITGALAHVESNMTCTDFECPYCDSNGCRNTWEPNPIELLKDVLKMMKDMEPEIYQEAMVDLYNTIHKVYDWYKIEYLQECE